MSDESSNSSLPAKKKKLESTSNESTSKSTSISCISLDALHKERMMEAKSIIDFKFNKNRVRILTETEEVMENSCGILYWMSRDCRVQDNWAFLFAQKLAIKNMVPLYVCFCLVPKFLDATIRHFKFLLAGIKEVEAECRNLNINFHMLTGDAGTQIPKFVKEHTIGGVVCDFSPLRVPRLWVDSVKKNLPKEVPLCQVDGHNIIPVWIASDKQEYAARTIRNKINKNLSTYLTQFPPVINHPHNGNVKSEKINWHKLLESLEVDRTIDEVKWAEPGYTAAVKVLQEFCEKRLQFFSTKRNDPLLEVSSNLSPWFHFGQISVQRSILVTQKFKSKYPESVASFCEEAIVRRELADNFCYYNEHYDSIKGLSNWAATTLNNHKNDKRTYLYTLDELEKSLTHDDLWNAAQIQLCNEGKMHGFLRMYWAKKILEWTESPEDALRIAIYLNDRYSLDGRDPNGYVGCMWSIGGIHDQGWSERPIFGKIRFMNYDGCKRKFDVKAFVARYRSKSYAYKKK